MQILKRLFNELPSLVVAGLVIAGVDQTEYTAVVELAGAVGAFGTWLLARRKIDGPATVLAEKTAPQGVGLTPPGRR